MEFEEAGTRTVTRPYTDDTHETLVLEYSVELPTGETETYQFNAVHIGCPDCRTNRVAIIRPDRVYECKCGYTNELNEATALNQQTSVEGEWK